MNRLKRTVAGFVYPITGRAWHFLATLVFLATVVPAIWALQKTGIKKRHAAPKVVFGATPLINSKYHSQALRAAGVDSKTVVRHYLGIATAQDFDIRFGDGSPTLPRLRRWYNRLLQVYVEFTKLLWDRDVFFYYFDGFYLRNGGPLKWFELQVLRALGKRIVAMHYGGDIVGTSEIRDMSTRYVWSLQYPDYSAADSAIRKQIRYFTKHAHAVIGAGVFGADYLPRVDYLCCSFLAINEKEWPATYGPPRKVGDVFRVLHSPNHRYIKGTRFVMEAVERLQREGLNIELVLLEGVPNEQVKAVLAQCHVLAEQFILGWHGLNGLEGMASGKPVLCYLREDVLRLYQLYSYANDLPIVNTPVESICDKLRSLYFHPEECERLGRAGRWYVERYHSLEGFGGFLKGVVASVWTGVPFDADSYWKARGAMQLRRDMPVGMPS